MSLYQKAWHRLRFASVALKRSLFNRRGDGVHSPFAFGFIRNVIRMPYKHEACRHLSEHQLSTEIKHGGGIVKRSYLELIFRCIIAHDPSLIYLHSGLYSAIPIYISASGYPLSTERLDGANLLIIEAMLSSLDIERVKENVGRNYMIILNKARDEVRDWRNKAYLELSPPIVFDMLDLEVWIWRPRTTPGYYPVYYK